MQEAVRTATRRRKLFESFVRVSGASGNFDGGVGKHKRNQNTDVTTEIGKPAYAKLSLALSISIKINLATYNNDSNSTYPFPDMSNSQTGATQRWYAELDTAIDLYRAEKFEECIAHTDTVFRDNTPLYPRLRYHMLLASCLDDWYEAEEMRFHAENTDTSWCLFNPIGSFPGAEQVRSDLRTSLDRIADDLKTFRPEDWKETQRFWNDIEAAEAQEEYAAEWPDEDKDGEEEDDEDEDEDEEEEDEAEEEGVAVAQSEEEAVLGAVQSGEGAAVVGSEEQVAVAQSERGSSFRPV